MTVSIVIPAKAGNHCSASSNLSPPVELADLWVPSFAGMTEDW